MPKEPRTFTDEICPAKPPRQLFYRIMERLGIEKKLKAIRKRLSFSYIALIIFGALVFVAVLAIRHEVRESEFGPLVSLFLSDTNVVMLYWHEFALSVLESMPLYYFILFLSGLLLLLVSLRLVVQYISRMSLLTKSICKHKHGLN